jgi:hypothetical protein
VSLYAAVLFRREIDVLNSNAIFTTAGDFAIYKCFYCATGPKYQSIYTVFEEYIYSENSIFRVHIRVVGYVVNENENENENYCAFVHENENENENFLKNENRIRTKINLSERIEINY